MPNGRTGDHPLTDILNYGSSAYPDDINSLVKEIAALPGFAEVRERVAAILWNDWPAWLDVSPEFSKVRSSLKAVLAELHSRGGGVPPAV
jgi:hypothetical protein